MFADATPESIAAFIVAALLLYIAGYFLVRYKLRRKIEQLLHVTDASKNYRFTQGGTAFQKYAGFRECETVLNRALSHVKTNFNHAEELLRQGESYLEGVPSLLLECVQKLAKRTQEEETARVPQSARCAAAVKTQKSACPFGGTHQLTPVVEDREHFSRCAKCGWRVGLSFLELDNR